MKKIFFAVPLFALIACSEKTIDDQAIYFLENGDSVYYSVNIIKKSSGGLTLSVSQPGDYDFGTKVHSSLGNKLEISHDSLFVIEEKTSTDKYGGFHTIETPTFLATINEEGILRENQFLANLNSAMKIQEKITKITIKP